MEQIIEQIAEEKTAESVEFGGVFWTKRAGRENTYNADMPGGEYVYVSQYDDKSWNWQRKFGFNFAEPNLLSDRAGGVVRTRDEAMRAALDADKTAYITELTDALAAAGFIGADSNYSRGFRDGQVALKAAISGIECGIGGVE